MHNGWRMLLRTFKLCCSGIHNLIDTLPPMSPILELVRYYTIAEHDLLSRLIVISEVYHRDLAPQSHGVSIIYRMRGRGVCVIGSRGVESARLFKKVSCSTIVKMI